MPPHWQKTDTIFQKYGNVESRWSLTTKNRPTKNLICFLIAKFCEWFKRFRKFWWITIFWGWGVGGGGAPGRGRQSEVCAPGAKNPRYASECPWMILKQVIRRLCSRVCNLKVERRWLYGRFWIAGRRRRFVKARWTALTSELVSLERKQRKIRFERL